MARTPEVSPERSEGCRGGAIADVLAPLRAKGNSERLDQLGNGGEEILDQAIVGDAEDRRLLVLVDRDDDLRVLHSSEVLDGAADANRDVQLRRDDLAGLADLPVVGRVAGVDGGAARAERGAELVGE